MEEVKLLVEKEDREQRAEGRQEMDGEAGAIGPDRVNALVPADIAEHRGKQRDEEHGADGGRRQGSAAHEESLGDEERQHASQAEERQDEEEFDAVELV